MTAKWLGVKEACSECDVVHSQGILCSECEINGG